jgi:MFS family permease
MLLVAMAIWGVYYELLGFGQQQFVADTIPLRFRSATWGILGIFRSIAYFLGPILGGALIVRNLRAPIFAAIGFVLISVVVLMSTTRKHSRQVQIDTHEVSIFREFAHWRVLFVHVWPVVILSLCIGLIDAVFWTIGAVWTEELADKSFLGSFILPSYMLPSIFIGFLVAKWQVFNGKKKLAEKLLLLSGFFLVLMIFTEKVYLFLILIFISSILLSIAYPLTDGVYSDIVARMGRERRHLIGLSQSTASLAYIAGPIVGGFLAGKIGERETFVVIGLAVALISFFLLMLTPRKLKLPQEEIRTWE